MEKKCFVGEERTASVTTDTILRVLECLGLSAQDEDCGANMVGVEFITGTFFYTAWMSAGICS
jgi:hypothetical protein